MDVDAAYVLLDALDELDKAISNGFRPWDQYDSGDDPKETKTGYRALMATAHVELVDVVQRVAPARELAA